ncbi:MAG: TetR family transcriptional regulator [Betaproteobacteria bacterium HGW-Betaproteobacteria-16]|nr:MAG: TetR family transcriptional regulator [Betaproteobacteria bacterium HGW-Betaproteobacteria-16]
MRIKQATHTRQAELVAAALALAAERSPAEVTTAALAQAVGITQGAVFRHFENKEAIWLAVIDFVHQDLLARLQAAATAHAQPMAALRAVFMAHVDFVVEQPGVPRVIFQELQQPQDTPLKEGVRRLMQAYRTLLNGLLQQAQASKQLTPGTDLAAAAVLFIGSVQGLVMQSLLIGKVGAMRALAPGVFALFHQAIAAPPARARRTQESHA